MKYTFIGCLRNEEQGILTLEEQTNSREISQDDFTWSLLDKYARNPVKKNPYSIYNKYFKLTFNRHVDLRYICLKLEKDSNDIDNKLQIHTILFYYDNIECEFELTKTFPCVSPMFLVVQKQDGGIFHNSTPDIIFTYSIKKGKNPGVIKVSCYEATTIIKSDNKYLVSLCYNNDNFVMDQPDSEKLTKEQIDKARLIKSKNEQINVESKVINGITVISGFIKVTFDTTVTLRYICIKGRLANKDYPCIVSVEFKIVEKQQKYMIKDCQILSNKWTIIRRKDEGIFHNCTMDITLHYTYKVRDMNESDTRLTRNLIIECYEAFTITEIDKWYLAAASCARVYKREEPVSVPSHEVKSNDT